MTSSPQARTARLVQTLHTKILGLLKDNIEPFYANSIDIREVYEGLHASIPGIIQWFYLCFQSISHRNDSGVQLRFDQKEVSIEAIEATEETLWCPEWGLKGVLDTVCDVQWNGQKRKIPVEIKTGSEDPISHTVQLLLYSVILAQFNEEVEFPLIHDGTFSGCLIYLKSDSLALPERREEECYEEIKNELTAGKRGPYISQLLLAVKKKTDTVTHSPSTASALQIREKPMKTDHCRSMLVRRNLLASYAEKEKRRVKKQIQQLESKECEIEDLVGKEGSFNV